MNERTRLGADLDDDIDSDADEFDEDLNGNFDDELDEDFDATSRRFETLKSGGRRVLAGVAEKGKERIVDAADRGKHRIADRLEDGADYLRNDIEIIQDDLVDAVRRNPLLSAGIAVGAGYLIGKAVAGPSFMRGRKKKHGIASQISRALVSSAAALLAAKLKDGFLEEPEEPVRRRSSGKRARPRRY